MLPLGLLLVWITLSVASAGDRSVAWAETKSWYAAAAGPSFSWPRPCRRRGRSASWPSPSWPGRWSRSSSAHGHGGLTTTADALDLAKRRRFSGGAGDPNYLAAGSWPPSRSPPGCCRRPRPPRQARPSRSDGRPRVALAATESARRPHRHGAALAVAVVPRARAPRADRGVRRLVVAAAGAFFLASPAALDRVTSFNAGGDGRSNLWLVAWRMSEAQPVAGVGIANFPVRSPDYVREPGPLPFVRIIVDEPLAAHNAYLQLLAETGIVGLVLLGSVVVACLAAAVRAARRFEDAGRRGAGRPRPRLGGRHGGLPRPLRPSSRTARTSACGSSSRSDRRCWASPVSARPRGRRRRPRADAGPSGPR